MSVKWQSIDTAPKDGTWLKVRGWDFGQHGSKRHYGIAFYQDGAWNEIGSAGGIFYYLTDWHLLCPQVTTPPQESASE